MDVVLYATDTRYAACAAASIRSLVSTWTDDVPPVVVVLDCGLTDQDRSRLAESFGECVLVVRFDYRSLLMLPQGSHFGSAANYARLLVGEIFPADVERILYLDCDTLVVRCVADHVTVDLGGRAVGAVPCPTISTVGKRSATWGPVSLGRPLDAPYFNNGVLLIDRDAWCSEDIGRRCLRFIDEHRDTLFPGQDALNAVVADRIARVDRSWNDMPDRNWSEGGWPSDSRPGSRVLHFGGPAKPWQPDYANTPVAALYRSALYDTVFSPGAVSSGSVSPGSVVVS